MTNPSREFQTAMVFIERLFFAGLCSKTGRLEAQFRLKDRNRRNDGHTAADPKGLHADMVVGQARADKRLVLMLGLVKLSQKVHASRTPTSARLARI